ncbi:MAG: metal-dependent hydrolase [Nitrosomonas sp.]|uniref:metal-dependent hydrolase n=1 Tax=Nitrosomonas sp. TaxID=42353 RepID=UPI001DC5203E|nr:metal-dependent hydrolase [Nitrosomonas sp.]MBX9895422.1 metal-dependent hydrolase [Nitrosomonas sp.]
MDPLTHALSGALLARATATAPARLPLRWQITAGFTAAAFPDIDLILRLIDTITYLNWHQGPTHSLILLPVWAWLLAWLFSRLSRGRFGWRLFYQPACLGLTIHIAGDLITSYGLMLFAPFSTERYSLPLVFVIDPWFSLIITAGLIASWRYPQHRIPAVAALLVLCGYVIFLFTLHQQAATIASRYIESQAISSPQIDLLPQPLSPFHWKIIIRNRETYHIADIDLSASTEKRQTGTWLLPRMAIAYRPVAENNWKIQQQFGSDPTRATLLREAWLAAAFTPFRAFAQFPVLDSVDVQRQEFCAWFYDLRFQFPELPPSFRYGVCRENDQADWRMMRQRGLFYID